MSAILIENDIMPTLENCINEINKVHNEAVQLEITVENVDLNKPKN